MQGTDKHGPSKKWFVLENAGHLGPYTPDELYQFYHQGKIKENSLLWRDGISDWLALKDCPEVYQALVKTNLNTQVKVPLRPEHLKHCHDNQESLVQAPKRPVLSPMDEIPALPDAPATLKQRLAELRNVRSQLFNSEQGMSPESVQATSQAMFAEVPPPLIEVQDEEKVEEQKTTAINPEEGPEILQDQELKKYNFEKMPFVDESESSWTESEKIIVPSLSSQWNQLQEITAPELPTIDVVNSAISALPRQKKWGTRFLRLAIILCISLSLPVAFSYLAYRHYVSSSLPQSKDLSAEKLKRLARPLEHLNSSEVKLGMAESLDGKKIYMAINRPGTMRVLAHFESVPGKTIGKNRIIFRSYGEVSAGIVTFDHFDFDRGNELATGLYSVRVSGADNSFEGKVISILQKLEVFNFVPLIRNYRQAILVEDKFILSTADEKDTVIKIKNYHRQVLEKMQGPMREQIQNFQTLMALSDKVRVVMEGALKQSNKRAGIRYFERSYARNIAPLLQKMILRENKKVEMREVDGEDLISHQKLFEFGRNLGVMVSQSLESLQKTRKWQASEKSGIEQQNKMEMLNFSSKAQKEVEALESKLAQLGD